jgi:hypothetical protein
MEKKIIHNLTLLRLVVGYLGEKNQYSWWSSSFLTENSKKILEFTFPRTASIAQYEGVSASAAAFMGTVTSLSWTCISVRDRIASRIALSACSSFSIIASR